MLRHAFRLGQALRVGHALYVVPAVTVAVVALGLLVVGAPRAVVGARLLGGPTDGGGPRSFRLELFEVTGSSERPLPSRQVSVEVDEQATESASWTGEVGEDGRAAVELPAPAHPAEAPTVTISAPWSDRPLAAGPVHLPRAAWWNARRVRGGPIDAPGQGELRVRVSPARGVLAVPFAAPLWLEVRKRGAPAPRVTLTARGEGLEVLGSAPPTNDSGRTVLLVRPTTHIAALELLARAPDGAEGRFYSTLPVVAGALDASVRATGRPGGPATLEVRSPVPRDVAYFSVIDDRGRRAGGTLALAVEGSGTAMGRVPLGLEASGRGWVVVSTEADLASPGAVGWPLAESTAAWLAGTIDEAPRSVTLPDTLLLDGVRAAALREEARQQRVRRLTALFALTALGLVVLLVVLRVQQSATELDRDLRRAAGAADAAALVPTPGRSLLGIGAAVLAIAGGFLVLVLLSLLRLQ